MSLPRSAIQKGKNFEDSLADRIVAIGLDDNAHRDGGSGAGNREKRDINTSMTIGNRTVGIEAKSHKVPHIKDWWKQTQELEKLGYEPVLVYKLFGESMGEAKAVMYYDTLLKLIKNQSDAKIQSEVQNSDKWILKSALEVLKKAIKVLEKYL